jgi:thiol-disulfide isomerase/thioredoxin
MRAEPASRSAASHRRGVIRLVAPTAVCLLAAASFAACSGDDDAGGRTITSGGLTVGGLDTADATVPRGGFGEQSFLGFDGETATFAQFLGKPLVVNFWGSWCVPCIKEMPEFESVHQELGDKVTFIGVNVQDSVADAQAMADKTGVTYTLVRDPRNELLGWIGGVSMPTTAFVDASGNVRNVISKQLSTDELKAEIEAIR